MRRNKLFRKDRIAMRIAARYGLTAEYKEARRFGLSPEEALEEWDMLLAEERKLFSDDARHGFWGKLLKRKHN